MKEVIRILVTLMDSDVSDVKYREEMERLGSEYIIQTYGHDEYLELIQMRYDSKDLVEDACCMLCAQILEEAYTYAINQLSVDFDDPAAHFE